MGELPEIEEKKEQALEECDKVMDKLEGIKREVELAERAE